jgi:radical SAM protein with 4Fe4S-binding SPASM domain
VEPSPVFAQIEPVGHCNLRCLMCPVRYRDVRCAFMTWEVYTSILDRLPNVAELHLQGLGEPLLHPRFFDMVAHAQRRGIGVSVNTNLTVLSPINAERMASCGLRSIFVSVDGAKAETYEHIRAGARFAVLERNVRMLLRALVGRHEPEVELTAVVMRRNLDELADLVGLAAGWNIGRLHVQHLCHDFGEATLPAQYAPMRAFVSEQTLIGYDATHVDRAFANARAAAARTGVALRLPAVVPTEHPAGTPGRARCDWPWHGPYITYDGTAMPCCIAATPDRVALGNIVSDGMDAVWNGPAYADFRRRLDSPNPPDLCRSCSVYQRVF